MEEYKIIIAEDFSSTPGGRWESLGPFSGEAFYKQLLLPNFEKAVESGQKLQVYLDGVRSYPYSFLDQSFGELSRVKGLSVVKDNIVFHATEKSWVIEYINSDVWKDEK